jgi:multidrug efflux pump subunit AcrA (membrane-fusion protein)
MVNPFRKTRDGVVHFYTQRSSLAFFSTLFVLFAIIALSHYLRTPEPEAVKPEREAKSTTIYSAASPLYLQATSQVKKDGVTQIVALTSGIVMDIVTKPGSAVQSGTTILTLTNDYNSGTTSLENEIARNNLLLTQEISGLDKDIQSNQTEIAEADDTLTRREREVELRTLEKARETRRVTLTNAELNYRLTTLNDAVLKPRSLSSGFVQSITVQEGDYVAPGTLLATISNPFGTTVVEAFVTSEIASYIDITKEAKITLANGTVAKVIPTYFSASEDQDGMFMIQFILSDEIAKDVPAQQNIKVELPLRFTNQTAVLVPLDTVYRNSDSAVVLVNVNGKAESRTVTLGHIRGNYIEVISGLSQEDQIILNRFVLAGDSIEVISE